MADIISELASKSGISNDLANFPGIGLDLAVLERVSCFAVAGAARPGPVDDRRRHGLIVSML